MAAQAGLCLAGSEIPEDTFCRVVAHKYTDSKWKQASKSLNSQLYIFHLYIKQTFIMYLTNTPTLWYFKEPFKLFHNSW